MRTSEIVKRLQKLLDLDWSYDASGKFEAHEGIKTLRNDLLKEHITQFIQKNPGADSEAVATYFGIDDCLASDLVTELIRDGSLRQELSG
jgi:hypothetical protein